MYKTKLRAWGIRKYNPEQAMVALAQTIEQRKKQGKASKVFKQGKPFAKAKIDSHLREKKKTPEELTKSTVIDAPMPEGFILALTIALTQSHSQGASSPQIPSLLYPVRST